MKFINQFSPYSQLNSLTWITIYNVTNNTGSVISKPIVISKFFKGSLIKYVESLLITQDRRRSMHNTPKNSMLTHFINTSPNSHLSNLRLHKYFIN